MRRGGYREREGVRRRAQAGANAWRAVEVVMTDRRIFKRLKVMSTLCDTGMPVQKGNLGNSIQFNSLFQTHLRSISHNHMSQHNRKMQKQHINDSLCSLAYTLARVMDI